MEPSREIGRLLEIMAALRTPETGCPWDLEQSFKTIAPYTIEEAYEVADAIAHEDMGALRDELGDLLLQVVFHAQMAAERGAFAFGDVVLAITEKLVRRHPHVFGAARALSADAVLTVWRDVKEAEKRTKTGGAVDGALSGVRAGRPALARARALQEAAARVGFDWDDVGAVLEKIDEETREVAEAFGAGDAAHIAEEIGDLMFAVVNLARHAQIDPETALASANAKFERRFAAIERALAARGITPRETTLADMDALWNAAKAAEKTV